MPMKDLNEIQNQFSRLLEASVEQRGFKTIHGRIIAYLLMSPCALTQQEIVDKTGYSVSAISRTLEELENLGSVSKFKEPGERSFRYETTTSIVDSLLNFVQKWLLTTKNIMNSIDKLVQEVQNIDQSTLKDSEITEINHFANKMNNIVESLNKIIPHFEKFMLQLNKIE